ncbi:MAG: NADH-quinone oxidoreductase subunit C [Vampirovibrionales bacterium]|jgi:NADH-quinone oxidoreductase subunit C|nr:NADH-quinone oxidoreductase subunit C [Vampirovibrionales bacterium]
MNEENKTPEQAPEAEVIETTPAIPAGFFGALLESKGIAVEHLGNDAKGTEIIRLTAEAILKAGELLKGDASSKLDMLLLVTGIDWKTHRESVYHLYSTVHYHSLIIKIVADANDTSPSLYPVWPAVDWHEREAYDLMGIHYEGHPDLRRILMPTYWLGHPLRKDYKEEDPRLVWNRR